MPSRIERWWINLKYKCNKGVRFPSQPLVYLSHRSVIIILVQLFYGIYLESYGEEELKLFGWIFSTAVNNWVLSHPVFISIILSVLVLYAFFASESRKQRKAQRSLNDRICEMIYKNYIETQHWDHNRKSSFRVSLLTVASKLTLNKKHNRLHTLNIGRDTHLEVAGRYLTTEGNKSSNFYLTPTQGAAGFSFHERVINERTLGVFEDDPEAYYKKCEAMGLSRSQVDSLNRKAAYYFCVPIAHHKDERIYGVISIDSFSVEPLPDDLKEEIEEFITSLKYLFKYSRNND